MDDFNAITLSGSTLQEFFGAYNALIRTLPPETRQRLSEIQKSYFAAYGLEGVYARMNNRTLSQIFAEFQPVEIKPIASGEEDGVQWALYDPANSPNDSEEE
jgi:hypothetical protein